MKFFTNKKKMICEAVFALIAMVFCFGFFSIDAKADTPGTVNDNNVNIRSGAGTDSTSLGKVNSGDKVTIIEETNGWYKVSLPGGTTGYIKTDFVTKSADGTGTTAPATTTTTTTTTTAATTPATTNVTAIDAKSAYIAGDIVNIRSQASANSDLVAKAQKNSEVTVTGEASASDGYKWYQVSFTADGATKKGFIRSDLVTFTKPTQAPAETNIDSNNTDTDPNPAPAETEPAPAETEPEPTEPEPEPKNEGVKAYEVKLLEPSEEPENLPDGFEEKSIDPGNGEVVKVWNKGDFYVVYGMNEAGNAGWYVLDYKTNNFVSYDGLFEQAAAKKSSSNGATIFGIQMKWILVICIILIIILLGAVFFLALKLSKGVEDDDDYEYEDYEDEDEYEDDIPVSSIEEEPSRKSKPVKEPKAGKKSAKDKFLDYFTTTVDDEEGDDEEYYDDVDDDDEDIDFIDI